MQIMQIVRRIASPALFAACVSAATRDGQQFPRQGTAGDSVMLPQWEISYSAENFKPVCGVSYEKEGDEYWSNSPECAPAMRAFHSSADRVQVYDTGGTVTTKEFGGGSELCLCFAVQFLPKPGKGLDICLAVGPEGQVLVRDGVGVGIQSPQDNQAKLLPPCGAASQTAGNTAAPTPQPTSNRDPRVGPIPGEANTRLAAWVPSMGVVAGAILASFF